MDYRSLLKNVEKTLSAIEGGDDVVSTVAAVGEAVVGNFRSELGIIGGRLYQLEDDDYVLKRGFGRSRKVPEGLSVPRSYGPIRRALEEGVVLADLKDPSVDRELEARLGVTRFAAVSFGDGAFILSFDVHPRVAADDLLVSLGIIRDRPRLEGEEREAREPARGGPAHPAVDPPALVSRRSGTTRSGR